MRKHELYDIIIAPCMTEKAAVLADQNRQVTFKVRKDANKLQVKRAIESIYNVVVDKVNIIKMKGKVKKHRGRPGKRSDWKKAYLTLAEGHDINFSQA